MPQLSEIVKNRKKFKKVEYRAWDPKGEWTEQNKNSTSVDNLNVNPFYDSENLPINPENNNFLNQLEPPISTATTNPVISRITPDLEKDHKKITKRLQTDHKENYKRITKRSQKKSGLTPQKDHKKVTNRSQTDHKQSLKGSQIDYKTEDKWRTNRSQKESASSQNHEIDHKRITKQITEKITNKSQIDHKIELSTVVGKEREMLFFIFSSCLKNRSTVSEPLTLEYITRNSNIRLTSIKTIINRLIDKKLLMRTEGKRGRGGWMRFELPDEIYNKILALEKETKWANGSQIDHKRVTEQITEQITSSLSSSSILKKETTNLLAPDSFSNSEWDLIDITPLKEIGFGEPQLRQLAKAEKLTVEQVQDSIHAFAFARKLPEVAKSIRTDHLNYFMGILNKKGEPYSPPPGYQSPKELALQVELERLKKTRAMEEERKSLAFEEWYGNLSKSDKTRLLEQELTDEQKETVFSRPVIPEHVRENKRREVLKVYFFNVVHNQEVIRPSNVALSDGSA